MPIITSEMTEDILFISLFKLNFYSPSKVPLGNLTTEVKSTKNVSPSSGSSSG